MDQLSKQPNPSSPSKSNYSKIFLIVTLRSIISVMKIRGKRTIIKGGGNQRRKEKGKCLASLGDGNK